MGNQSEIRDSTSQFEQALKDGCNYRLYLYVVGMTMNSTRATEAIRDLCQTELKNRCQLHIIDLYKSPERAREDQIIAVPTLVRAEPPPLRKLVGDLSNRSRVLRFLELSAAAGKDLR